MKLFLLNPNFTDSRIPPEGQSYYCPHCAMIEGILHYFPELNDKIEIIHIDFPRPRKLIVEILGEENQGCPLLIISRDEAEGADTSYFSKHGDWLFVNNKYDIARFLGERFGMAIPHP